MVSTLSESAQKENFHFFSSFSGLPEAEANCSSPRSFKLTPWFLVADPKSFAALR